jgi:hypothetical protein
MLAAADIRMRAPLRRCAAGVQLAAAAGAPPRVAADAAAGAV